MIGFDQNQIWIYNSCLIFVNLCLCLYTNRNHNNSHSTVNHLYHKRYKCIYTVGISLAILKNRFTRPDLQMFYITFIYTLYKESHSPVIVPVYCYWWENQKYTAACHSICWENLNSTMCICNMYVNSITDNTYGSLLNALHNCLFSTAKTNALVRYIYMSRWSKSALLLHVTIIHTILSMIMRWLLLWLLFNICPEKYDTEVHRCSIRNIIVHLN